MLRPPTLTLRRAPAASVGGAAHAPAPSRPRAVADLPGGVLVPADTTGLGLTGGRVQRSRW
eukprot:gene10495-21_t